jgi:hypothetical protein
MATISQIRGMLLEEALLYLLQLSGYRTVGEAGRDPTLHDGSSGLQVLGRGGKHQIDAIANFIVAHPFSHPQRLLVEAKCYAYDRNHVGIEVIRNAVGVLKDVGEYWVSRGGVPPKARYHYQYALFSATGYTSDAERYAYAQDIYLIPLAKSKFFKPIIDSIRKVNYQAFEAESANDIKVNMTRLRQAIRRRLKDSRISDLSQIVDKAEAKNFLEYFCRACRELKGAVLAMIAKQFPVFLVPNPEIELDQFLRDLHRVHIYWDNEAWYLYSVSNDTKLFSFDLPPELFELYAEQGVLSETLALDLNRDFLSEIQATVMLGERIRIVTFKLDKDWLEGLCRRLGQLREDRETENYG